MLTNAAKDMVTNYNVLVSAEEALFKLKEENYDKKDNLAFGAAVNGTADSGWNASKLVDGLIEGNADTGNMGWGLTQNESFEDAPVNLIIDIGENKLFNSFYLYPGAALSSEVLNFPTSYTIFARSENEGWQIIYETTEGAVPTDVHTPVVVTLDDVVNAQYIMFAISGVNNQENKEQWAVQMAELELYYIENAGAEAADAVEALINAIGTVTLDSEAAILAARNAYNALTNAQKAMVENVDQLTAAEAVLAELKQNAVDQQKAGEVDALISDIGTVTLDSEAAIVAARNAYDMLTDAQKAMVQNLGQLTAAEEVLEQLKNPGVTEPDVTEPDVTEPDETEPGVTEPGKTEPTNTIPVGTDPGRTDVGNNTVLIVVIMLVVLSAIGAVVVILWRKKSR